MRTNLPITQNEYTFAAGESLVSSTDLKGRILYCNPPFVEVSGFTKQELLGQPHNLIRHPHMPEETYRDMWATIQSGQPWSGMVKNRRKNGDYYWVMANVTPLMEGEQPRGYLSVRTCPTRGQIDAAEALYATMRAEKSAGTQVHRLAGGHLARSGWRGRVDRLRAPGLPFRLSLACTLACATSFVLGWLTPAWGWVGSAALALAVGAVTGWRVRALTTAPLESLLRSANRMAAGDLTVAVASGRQDLMGRVAQALNQLTVNLMSVVRDTRREVDCIRASAGEIASGNQDLSTRTESQASSLEQTVARMGQITGTVRQSADAAQQAAQLARTAEGIARRSSEEVGEVTRSMQAISQSSQRIAEIVQVIDSISFQTNILALNAAVEAARAGEQGRGFAVVAGEVRSLAQRTSTAAKEIGQLIAESAGRVDAGAQQVDRAHVTMDESLEAVRRVSALIGEISTGASAQLDSISQVNAAVAHLDGLTQQNAAMVEQLAASTVGLSTRAEGLSESVGVFHVGAGTAAPVDAVALRRQMKQHEAAAAPA